jgi:hypothetical protein
MPWLKPAWQVAPKREGKGQGKAAGCVSPAQSSGQFRTWYQQKVPIAESPEQLELI